MTYQLINPKGTIHDFAHKMSWGHNIEESSSMKEYGFDELVTQQGNWSVFHYFPIHRGDFIIRNMNSGKVGVYEVQSANQNRCGSPFGPDDLYECEVLFCGYYNKTTKCMSIFNGYGIHTSWFGKLIPRRNK